MSAEQIIGIDELIRKFKNGQDLYHKSAMFNQVIHMLAHGVDIYIILEDIIIIHEEKIKEMEKYVLSDTRPFLVDKEVGEAIIKQGLLNKEKKWKKFLKKIFKLKK